MKAVTAAVIRQLRNVASTIFFDPRYTGAVMLAAIAVAVIVTVIPLLRDGGRAGIPDDDDDLTLLRDSVYGNDYDGK